MSRARPWWARLLRMQVWNWPVRGPWWARARRWLLHAVLRHDSECCDACGGRVLTAWLCRDDMWRPAYARATGRDRGDSGLLCERCFAVAFHASSGQNVFWVAVPIRESCEVFAKVGATKESTE